jgi:ubiquinone biosynthesis monooxygenase Coq7
MTSELSENMKRMIRVNHAGEYGAIRIYKGQLWVLRDSSIAPTLHHMEDQEKEHKREFDELLIRHHVRPTLLSPLWKVAGFALGAGSALLGKKAAMACTVAVEEVIDEHYQGQLQTLEAHPSSEATQDLQKIISKCHQEELDHRDIGLEHQAAEMKGYSAFKAAVKTATRLAIWLSTRI